MAFSAIVRREVARWRLCFCVWNFRSQITRLKACRLWIVKIPPIPSMPLHPLYTPCTALYHSLPTFCPDWSAHTGIFTFIDLAPPFFLWSSWTNYAWTVEQWNRTIDTLADIGHCTCECPMFPCVLKKVKNRLPLRSLPGGGESLLHNLSFPPIPPPEFPWIPSPSSSSPATGAFKVKQAASNPDRMWTRRALWGGKRRHKEHGYTNKLDSWTCSPAPGDGGEIVGASRRTLLPEELEVYVSFILHPKTN